MTKMAVYQPRRAAIATILVAVMQDDIREELPYCIEPALVTPADRKTIMHYHPLGQTEKTIMNYHVEFEHVQTA